MFKSTIATPTEVLQELIKKEGTFPNNPLLPILIYKNAFHLSGNHPEIIEETFLLNEWKNPWRNGIYSFHHYHSNTHEVLGIYAGTCTVQLGGPNGPQFQLQKGDVLILPAGISHKNIDCSWDFKCIGAYPFDAKYDMNYGKEKELLTTEENIKNVPLPKTDPVYGNTGPLFEFWKFKNSN